MNSLGDFAAQVAEELKAEHEGSIEDPEKFLDEQDPMEFEARKSIFQKIQYKWRASDQMILEQIKSGATKLFEEQYANAIVVIDEFYLKLRVPTGRIGPDGRPIWEKDEQGHFIEDWDQLTGQDIQRTLLDLQLIKFQVSPQVNQLLLEAVYAKHVANDTHDDAWGKVLTGTQLDREAKANQVSRTDKYHAFFRYYLFRSSDTFLKEINDFINLLEKMVYWGIRSQER